MSFRLVVCAMLSTAATACSDDDACSVDAPYVMDAWIESDGYPVVMLTRTLKPGTKPVDITDVVVRWAKVTISDGERTVVMTGGVDDTVFPPYSYRSYAFKGEVGRTYTIEAEYTGHHLKAVSEIRQPGKITDLRFCKINDSIYSATLDFVAPDDMPKGWFVAYTRVRNIETRHYPAFMGLVSTDHAGEAVSMPLLRGRHADLDEYIPNFCYGDTVDVILASVSADVYQFWQRYQEQVYFGNNIFLSATDRLKGNVDGGYGVFSACGASRRIAVVSND